MKLSEPLCGRLLAPLTSTISVFSLVCLQGRDDETENRLGQRLSLACQSVPLFSFCISGRRGVLHNWAETHEIDIGRRDYLQLKLQKRKGQEDRMASAESQVKSLHS